MALYGRELLAQFRRCYCYWADYNTMFVLINANF